MERYRWIYLGLFITIFGCEKPKELSRIQLNEHWEFKQVGTDNWRTANVPGVVHTDLMNHDLIPHPWKGTNELDVQWIENEDWIYQTTFTLSESQLEYKGMDLVFEGLDTYAEVRLNNQPVLETDNMFRTWRISAKELLKVGRNSLIIKFISPIKANTPRLDSLGYELPAGSEAVERKVSPFTRKAPYHFGWDWGPRLVTSGVWRPVYLELYDAARISNIQILQKELSDSVAKLEAVIAVEATLSERIEVDVFGTKLNFDAKKGINEFRVPFMISNPKRWWPNGWGEAHMYEIPVSVYTSGQLLDTDTINIGLREVELIQETDSIGESYYFVINGEKLFARGANYIPQSHFLPSVSNEDYSALLADVKKSGMNMLRVWGGGIYENDIFYDLCDKNGILVWQDFMFAGSMYPGDSAFIHNVEAEITDNVKRLRNHPSIVQWNGNNEIEVAWKNWGWQQQYGYSMKDSTRIWNDYLNLFHRQIPDLLAQLDNRPYTTTSPLSNWGTPDNFNYSSMHYWGVWHGNDDFEDYRENVGRFMSEYGFQSFPAIETISFFADSTEWNLDSEVMNHHQKSYVGNEMITKQMAKYFEESIDFEDFVAKSQQTQALAIQMAIDAHRLKKGHCWGSLFWQLNDCWPGPSWSAIDVFGRKKVLFKELETLFAPIALITQWEDQLVISLVNDSLEEIEGHVRLTLFDDENNASHILIPVSSHKNSIKEIYHVKPSETIHRAEMQLILADTVHFARSFKKDDRSLD